MSCAQLPEKLRNELLRRVDWRFLLRQRAEPTSISFGSGRLAHALKLVSAPAMRDDSGTKPVDLVALVNPRRRALEVARDALRPGGELYVEWDAVAPNAPARIRKRLGDAGFADVRCYWPWPWPRRASAQWWLPLDAPAALEFVVASRAHEADRSWRRKVLHVLGRLALRVGAVAPVCAVACRPGSEKHALEEVIRHEWDGWGFGPPPDRLTWLLLTGGRRSINKVVGLVFGGADRSPRLAVKFARSEFDEDGLRREAETLESLASTRPALERLPRALRFERRCGRLSLVETAVPGEPLIFRLERETYAYLASRATAWLTELAGAPAREPRAVWWPRLIDERLHEFEETFGRVASQAELAQARASLSRLGELPVVCEHRDFAPWNVLLNEELQIGLVDWESSEPRGLPALDLIYFLTYCAFLIDDALASGSTLESYSRMLASDTFTGRVARSCEFAYCERVGIDPELLGPLRLLGWIIHSRSEYERLVADAAGVPLSSALHSSLFLGLWKEEVRRSGEVSDL